MSCGVKARFSKVRFQSHIYNSLFFTIGKAKYKSIYGDVDYTGELLNDKPHGLGEYDVYDEYRKSYFQAGL